MGPGGGGLAGGAQEPLAERLRGIYLRLKRHKGANKAKVAVARKLCELVWHVWQGERLYEERRPRVALSPP
jgi:hypothetical protein